MMSTIDWIFADSQVPNWFLCLCFSFLFIAGLAIADSSKQLRKATKKWEDVYAMYTHILANGSDNRADVIKPPQS